MAEDIHAFQDGRTARMDSKPRDGRRSADWLEGWDQVDSEPRHCDDYIDDPEAPACLRAFLDHSRAPAHGSQLGTKRPALFADYEGKRVRIVMASRFGDVGITSALKVEHGYDRRVNVSDLSNFADTPAATMERKA